jgi:hypothetical protein
MTCRSECTFFQECPQAVEGRLGLFLISRTTSGSASLKKPWLSPGQVFVTRVPSADGSSVMSTSR